MRETGSGYPLFACIILAVWPAVVAVGQGMDLIPLVVNVAWGFALAVAIACLVFGVTPVLRHRIPGSELVVLLVAAVAGACIFGNLQPGTFAGFR